MVGIMAKVKEDASATFAKNAAAFKYADLPADVVDMTKKCVMDTLGVIIAGAGITPDIGILVEMMRELGGKKESTILSFGDKVPAWHAAYVNGSAAHCLDYDDMHQGAGHISAPTLPAAFAIAERQRVTGKELLTAAALGLDMHCRLSMATDTPPGEGFFNSPVFGHFSSALACGKLLGLSADKITSALGIAFGQASGTWELVFQSIGSNARGMYCAPPAEVGVRAALLAQRGIGGISTSFEGTLGLINVYRGGKCDRDVLVGDLGKRFPVLTDGFKPWPCCGVNHPYIDATLSLVKEHNLRPEEIESIMLSAGEFALTNIEPLEAKRRPETNTNAEHSVPYNVAVALQRRNVRLVDLTAQALKDPQVLALTQRVNYQFDPAYNMREGGKGLPGKVEVKTKDGRTLSMREDTPYGRPEKPMSWDDLVAKFKDCAKFAHKPVPQTNVDKAAQLLLHLEEVPDVSQIIKLLS